MIVGNWQSEVSFQNDIDGNYENKQYEWTFTPTNEVVHLIEKVIKVNLLVLPSDDTILINDIHRFKCLECFVVDRF